MGDISIKLSAFGLNCATVDGHNHTDLLAALQQTSDGPPIGIISNTVKGKGVVDMENNPAWHHAAPTLDQLDSFIKELR
jgi:transketolase